MDSGILKNVRLVDVEAGTVLPAPHDILLEQGRISAVGPLGQSTMAGQPALDGGGCFAIPGLIDCHCHVTGNFLPTLPGPTDFTWIFKQIELNLRAHLQSGVTTVRDAMAPLKLIQRWQQKAHNPASALPRILCAGPMLTVRGGYPAFIPPDTFLTRWLLGPLRVNLKNPQDAQTWVDRLADAGVNFIKVGYSSRDYDNEQTPLAAPSDETFTAISKRAAHHGLPVMVHHTWLQDLKSLLKFPFDTLEHVTVDEDLDAETLDALAKRNLGLTTDLEIFSFVSDPQRFLKKVAAPEAPVLPKARAALEKMTRTFLDGQSPNPHFGVQALSGATRQIERNVRLLSSHGITLGAATDAGTNQMFGTLWDELAHLVRAGLSPAQALRAGTVDAARLIGRRDLGTLKAGQVADIVLLKNNPFEELRAPSQLWFKPHAVFREGMKVV